MTRKWMRCLPVAIPSVFVGAGLHFRMGSIEGGSTEFVQFQLRLFQAFDQLGIERAIEESVPIRGRCTCKDDFKALIQRTNSLGSLNSYEHQGGNPPRESHLNTAG